jgi:hypothetical protein
MKHIEHWKGQNQISTDRRNVHCHAINKVITRLRSSIWCNAALNSIGPILIISHHSSSLIVITLGQLAIIWTMGSQYNRPHLWHSSSCSFSFTSAQSDTTYWHCVLSCLWLFKTVQVRCGSILSWMSLKYVKSMSILNRSCIKQCSS